jgi:hypothetical protein
MKRYLIICILLFSFCHASEGVYRRPPQVPPEVWERVSPHFLPPEHPIKQQLDKIFKKHRVLDSEKSLAKAGFTGGVIRKWTRLVVAKHPKMKGFVFKAYLDTQHPHRGLPEYEFWLKRIEGTRILKEYIDAHHWQDEFKVPRKWIYPLPEKPHAKGKYPKNFLLIAEDMDIYSDAENERIWESDLISPTLLDHLFQMITDLGFRDCAKPDNIPFARDGRVALIDTQSFYEPSVAYGRLLHHLNPANKAYWDYLINHGLPQ